MSICQYMYHCNNCYGDAKNDSEGCFTNDVDKFKKDKLGSCLNGDWDEFDDDLGETIPGSCIVKPDFKNNKLFKEQ